MNIIAKKYKRKPIPPRPKRVEHNWSSYQNNIFDEVEHGSEHLAVIAVPGSGKTATIKEATYRIPKELQDAREILCCAFNKGIATKLRKELPTTIEALTFHAIAFRSVQKHWGPVYGINGYSVDKNDEIAPELALRVMGGTCSAAIQKNLMTAMRLAKAELKIEPEEIELLCLDHGIKMDSKDFPERVQKMIHLTVDEPGIVDGKSVISFDDMLFLPWYHNWQPVRQFERVFVDEAQDLSAARQNIVLGSLAHNGRLALFGDPIQAIYAWCGSDSTIMDTCIQDLDAKTMPLSVSYRLPKKVIELAKRINPFIESAPDAIDGTVIDTEHYAIAKNVQPGDAVLSRTNFPLVQACFHLLSKGIRANIRGRDIGQRFLWRIDCWQPDNVEHLKNIIRLWCDEVCEMLVERGRPFDRIEDEANSILQFCNHSVNLGEVRKQIKEFFTDDEDNSVVMLSTAHKAKGLEWNRVMLIADTFKHNRPNASIEETNIWYVALTRPKHTLMIANGQLKENYL